MKYTTGAVDASAFHTTSRFSEQAPIVRRSQKLLYAIALRCYLSVVLIGASRAYLPPASTIFPESFPWDLNPLEGITAARNPNLESLVIWRMAESQRLTRFGRCFRPLDGCVEQAGSRTNRLKLVLSRKTDAG